MKNAISVKVGGGRNFHRSAWAAIENTWSEPPARSAEKNAMMLKPITSTIIWIKSVQATARKPPITT